MSDLFFALVHFIDATAIPMVGLVLTGALLIYGLYARFIDMPQKWLLSRPALGALVVVALLCNAWMGIRMYSTHSAKQARQDGAVVREGRERFVLPIDFQYGELLIPAGSLINRRDPFDKGEPDRPLALHGLDAVRFAQPVQIAGVWATALQVFPLRVELAQDQRVGPVYRYDSASQSWVVHKIVPALACKKGHMALFQVPHVDYDVQAEVGKPPPDGADARFLPSQWLFRGCEAGAPIVLEPARAGGAPPAASQ